MQPKIARRFILRSILDNREARTKAVYANLVARGLIQPVLSDGSSVQVAASKPSFQPSVL